MQAITRTHPRTMGWVSTSALAIGGSNQSLFLLSALLIGQGSIRGQGTAAIMLLAVGMLLGWMALPGWIELILMYPNRVGGIAATCSEAFRPYAPVLANLTGVSYWWGWVPTCGLTALLSASAIQQWYLPSVPVAALACAIVCTFTVVNLVGVKWAARLSLPIAGVSALLAFTSSIVPVLSRSVDWHRAATFHLDSPFPGLFGKVTSAMAGLYLVGFAAPAFEAAACHVGETIDPNKNVPRAMVASALMATLYFVVLPVIWLGAIGPQSLAGDLAETLGPTFAPLLGSSAKGAAIAFMVFNMLNGTLAPLTGVARTLSQLSEDGLLPKFFAERTKTDCPWVAVTFTAGCACVFLLIGDPIWLVAAANFTYLIGIALPNVAVWLLRRDRPDMQRPFRAPRGTLLLGLLAASIWGLSTVLGFQQFGLPTVLLGLAMAYSGAALYAWRKWSDRRSAGLPGIVSSVHVKLTGAMVLVLMLDGAGYYLAVKSANQAQVQLICGLEDIFVAVAMLTISAGLVLPGMIAHSVVAVTEAAQRLATGTLADFSRAMKALSDGDLDGAHARIDVVEVVVHTNDEIGKMAGSFNTLQQEVARAALGLAGAREGLRSARAELTETNAHLEQRVIDRTAELEGLHNKLVEAARRAGMAEVAIGVLHNVGNVLNSVNVSAALMDGRVRKSKVTQLGKAIELLTSHAGDLGTFLSTDQKGKLLPAYLVKLAEHLTVEQAELITELTTLTGSVDHIKHIVTSHQSYAREGSLAELLNPTDLMEEALSIGAEAQGLRELHLERRYGVVPLVKVDKHKLLQILVNLVKNARAALSFDQGERNLSLTVDHPPNDRERVIFQVCDNGIGIPAESLTRIFEHGFTTKEDGHGFGLHSSALAAKAIGGSLRVESAGWGTGATFTVDIPLQAL
jgi:amino acid transporter/signal transduction histidine kinase